MLKGQENGWTMMELNLRNFEMSNVVHKGVDDDRPD